MRAFEGGMPRSDIADLYDFLKKQIEAVAGGSWRANRWECVDGSVVFLGEIHVLVISDTGIFAGKINALVTPASGTVVGGRFLFPAPNFDAATEKIC